MTINKTKTILTLSITATILLTVVLTSNTLTPAMAQVTNTPPPPTSACPPNGQVEHWDKIIFTLNPTERTGKAIFVIPKSDYNTELDVKVLDNPGVAANLKQEVADILAIQFTLTPSQETTLLTQIKITDDKYEIVTCGETGPQGPAGATGATGPAGPAGPPGSGGSGGSSISFYKVDASGNAAAGQVGAAVALCNAGDTVTGGGYNLPAGGSGSDIKIELNIPYQTQPPGPVQQGWDVAGLNPSSGSEMIETHAICEHTGP